MHCRRHCQKVRLSTHPDLSAQPPLKTNLFNIGIPSQEDGFFISFTEQLAHLQILKSGQEEAEEEMEQHTRISSPNMEHHHHHHHLGFHIRATATTLNSPTTTTTNNPYSMEKPLSKGSDHRRSNKPIMEKRRRARINHCLGELKGLILEAMKKDPARHSKLEKADILEMTVKHLQNMQRQQMAVAVATDPTVMTKFRAGFNECATEVARYVSRIEGVEPGVRQRLLVHLRSCLTGLNYLTPGTFACLLPESGIGQATFMPPNLQPVHVQVSPSSTNESTLGVLPPQAPFNNNNNAGGAGESRMFSGLHLVPSRLPNGDIAFVLPQQRQPPAPVSPPSQESEDESRNSTPSTPPNRTSPPTTPLSSFPNNSPMTTTATTTNTANRRTPSAFTSVLNNGSGNNSSLLRVSHNSSTTCPTMSSVFSSTPFQTNNGNKNIPLLCIKREDPSQYPSRVKSSSGSSESKDSIPSVNNENPARISPPPPPPMPPPPPPPPSKSPPPSKCKSQTSQNCNQSEAYDLSRPSTSNVCSMTDNDKMWRPW